jgi:hypothetical protein
MAQSKQGGAARGVADACGDQIRTFDATVFPSA